MEQIVASNLGFPRIGENREWKKSLEAFWANKIDEVTLEKEMKLLRLGQLKQQQDRGISLIPVNNFTLYDQMLDTSTMFGLIPKRFGHTGGPVTTDTYFSMARGSTHAVACEMTKWFNTNYHYIVPELHLIEPVLTINRPLLAYKEAKAELGIVTKPVLIGPYTFVKLSKGYPKEQLSEWVHKLLPLYRTILAELQAEGVSWVQMDEPSLTGDVTLKEMTLIQECYRLLHQSAPKINIMLQTYFDAVEFYDEIITLPVQGIGLDFVHGLEQNIQALERGGFPSDKALGIGIIDGRNIWRCNPQEKLHLLQRIQAASPHSMLIIQPSCSLIHVPVSATREVSLEPLLRQNLAFAYEKLEEIQLLTRILQNGENCDAETLSQVRRSSEITEQLNDSPTRRNAENEHSLRKRYKISRVTPFAARYQLQQENFKLPLLPTTTIGSFPQTAEVRKARQLWRGGEWSDAQYNEFINEQIREWIMIQEDIGLDVLVHGEFERTDMVEYFGEKLAGFAFTTNGWVQSYGSRCVKPPIIYGNVAFQSPMTVQETLFAQSLTQKPVKGMLTGPVTILNWSFVRDDIPRPDVTMQIAAALAEEVKALEEAGISMIQVDEPALREGLPLKKRDWDNYLEWAVKSFLLSTSNVQDTTQIHTHMCYCEFQDMIEAIQALDADVISIESSRSNADIIEAFESNVYDRGIGLGVYDIHSPRVPRIEEIDGMIDRALRVLPSELFWINPDCGLKTRSMSETHEALTIMIQSAKKARQRLLKH
ncbi:MAG: 5-methyltetrahydropteroyltriglutamate--homocysteine S-methyltransferase [Paenibacillaceae bacterium]